MRSSEPGGAPRRTAKRSRACSGKQPVATCMRMSLEQCAAAISSTSAHTGSSIPEQRAVLPGVRHRSGRCSAFKVAPAGAAASPPTGLSTDTSGHGVIFKPRSATGARVRSHSGSGGRRRACLRRRIAHSDETPQCVRKSVNCPNARSIVAWLPRVVMGSPCPEMSNAFPGTNLIVLGGVDRGTTRRAGHDTKPSASAGRGLF